MALTHLRWYYKNYKKQEEIIEDLGRQLRYYMDLSSFLIRPNPLPRPPEPIPFEHQRRFSQNLIYNNQRIPMIAAPRNSENPNDSSLSLPTQVQKNKGKEREPGPSYDLSSITSSITTAVTTFDSTTTPIVAHPLSASQNRTSCILSPEQALRNASPHCNVVPMATSKPAVPDAPSRYDPKIVPEAPHDQLVPPRPPTVREPVIARVGSATAHVDDCAVGYGAGYHLAEYTPGEAARVITDLPQRNAVAYTNSDMNERCYRIGEAEGQKGLDDMNSVSNAFSRIVGATSTARSRQGGNSQVYNNHVPSFGRTDDYQNFQMAPLQYPSFVSDCQSQRTQVAEYQTENETSTTRSLGLTEDGMSTKEIPQNHHMSESRFSLALYGTIIPDETTASSNIRSSHQFSLPGQSAQPISVPVTTVPNATTIPAVVTTAEHPSARNTGTVTTSDSGSVTTTPSPNTHSMPLLDWQGTGSSLDLNLRGFACGAGTTMMRATDVENRGPILPEGMVVSHHSAGDSTASVNRAKANDGNGFSILRESDEERTPLSRSTRALSSASSPGIINRDRNIRTTQSQDRTERREEVDSIYTRTASMLESAAELPPRSSQVRPLYLTSQQLRQENSQALSSSSDTQPTFPITSLSLPQTQSQSQWQPQVHSQSHSCCPNHRLSVPTALQTVEPQHARPQSAAHNTAPLHALSDWSEVGCCAEDGLSTSQSRLLRLLHDTYPSNRFNNGGSQGPLTSPTLFNFNSNTNALGLDGLNEPQPLHIAAPTPVVSNTNFLRSFSK